MRVKQIASALLRFCFIVCFAEGCGAHRHALRSRQAQPDIALTVNGPYKEILCLRPCEAYFVVRLADSAPDALLQYRAVAWDFGDGSTAFNDTYNTISVRYGLSRWYRYHSYGRFPVVVRLLDVEGRVVGMDSATVEIVRPES